jgi:hypothetical protein
VPRSGILRSSRRVSEGAIISSGGKGQPASTRSGRKEDSQTLFHVSTKAHDAVFLDDDKRVREAVGPHLQRVMQSGKVREAGIFSDTRGGFFLVDIDTPEELFELFGPEVYANFQMEAHPVTSMEKIGELFQRWATEGR